MLIKILFSWQNCESVILICSIFITDINFEIFFHNKNYQNGCKMLLKSEIMYFKISFTHQS